MSRTQLCLRIKTPSILDELSHKNIVDQTHQKTLKKEPKATTKEQKATTKEPKATTKEIKEKKSIGMKGISSGLIERRRKTPLISRLPSPNNLEELEEPIKKKKINEIANNIRPKCMARIASGLQCRRCRNPTSESDFCTCHEKHCPYGRIDGPFEGKFLNIPKKRGPKFKHMKEYKLEELNQDLYIQTELVNIDGKCYLIEENGLLFTNDNNCEIVARRVENEIHWYI